MLNKTTNLIKLAEKLDKKYLIKSATSESEIKNIISTQAKSSDTYIPSVDGVNFIQALDDINRNASIKIKFGTEKWYDIISSPRFFVSPFSFETGTPQGEVAKFAAVPKGIENFLNKQGAKMGIKNGEWLIIFP